MSMEHKISNGVPENVLPSEDTPLLSGSDDGNGNHHNGVTPSSQGSGVSSSDRNSTASESSDSDKVRVEDPWPRSFERSISLRKYVFICSTFTGFDYNRNFLSTIIMHDFTKLPNHILMFEVFRI